MHESQVNTNNQTTRRKKIPYANRTDVRYLAVVFVGKTDYFVEEVF